jgi:PiT family inorganic phosphate transporter
MLTVGAMLFIAYANGANDISRGWQRCSVAGPPIIERPCGGQPPPLWRAGCLAAGFLATKLIAIFQGKGLLPPFLTESQPFLAAVILGAALTVFLATRIGISISTTHSLIGALFGSGFVAVGLQLGFDILLTRFFLPLIVSPLLAVTLVSIAYPLLRRVTAGLALSKASCVCIGSEIIPAAVTAQGCVMPQTGEVSELLSIVRQCARNVFQEPYSASTVGNS